MGYQRDLAEIHHLHYDEVARSAAIELVSRLQRLGVHEGLVLDLGCGSGVTAAALTDAGYDVLGIDISPAMIALAEQTAPKATFRCQSLFDTEIPECVAVIAISEAINYVFDERISHQQIADLLGRIHQRLATDGLVMLDVATPDRIGPGEVTELRVDGEDYLILVRAEGSENGRRLTRDITLFRADGDRWRRSDEQHVQLLFTPELVTEELLSAGFHVDVLSTYADYAFPKGWNGFLGRKRS